MSPFHSKCLQLFDVVKLWLRFCDIHDTRGIVLCLSLRTVGQVSQVASTCGAVADGRNKSLADNSPEPGLPVHLDSEEPYANGNMESNSEEEKDINENDRNGTSNPDSRINEQQEIQTEIGTKKRKTKKHLEVVRKL